MFSSFKTGSFHVTVYPLPQKADSDGTEGPTTINVSQALLERVVTRWLRVPFHHESEHLHVR